MGLVGRIHGVGVESGERGLRSLEESGVGLDRQREVCDNLFLVIGDTRLCWVVVFSDIVEGRPEAVV